MRAQAQRLQEEAERERIRQLALAAEAQGELFPLTVTQSMSTGVVITLKGCELQVMVACPGMGIPSVWWAGS